MDDSTPAILSPPRDATAFTVNGTTYTATDGLSVARMRIFDRLSQEFGADTTLRGLATDMSAIRDALNKVDFVLCASLVQRRIDALAISGENRIKSVEICGLFFNSPGEDPGAYDFAKMQHKCYTDWRAVAGGFFTVASYTLLGASLGPYATPPEEPEATESQSPWTVAP